MCTVDWVCSSPSPSAICRALTYMAGAQIPPSFFPRNRATHFGDHPGDLPGDPPWTRATFMGAPQSKTPPDRPRGALEGSLESCYHDPPGDPSAQESPQGIPPRDLPGASPLTYYSHDVVGVVANKGQVWPTGPGQVEETQMTPLESTQNRPKIDQAFSWNRPRICSESTQS